MKKQVLVAIAFLLLPACATTVVIDDVNVVDVAAGRIEAHRFVTIRNERIESIATTSVHARRHIDGRGKYLIPGLTDMHVHLMQSEPAAPPRLIAARLFVPLLVAAGVTMVRDMGSPLEPILALRAEVRHGGLRDPSIVAAGPVLDGPSPWAAAGSDHSIVVKTPEEGRAAVRRLETSGVDFIKVHDFLSRETFLAIADEARIAGLPLAGHLRPSVSPIEALRAGQVSFEHFSPELLAYASTDGLQRTNAFYDAWIKGGMPAFFSGMTKLWRTRDDVEFLHIAAAMREASVAFVPTLILRAPSDAHEELLTPGLRKRCEESLASAPPEEVRRAFDEATFAAVLEMKRAGVMILAGSDSPHGCDVLGSSLHEELELLERAGLSPAEVLQSATSDPARFLHATDRGAVVPRAIADLVLLDANPLQSVANTRRITGVFLRGEWMPRERLDAMRRQAAAFVHALASP
jgi:imidazolonepropionase-like amidohydrolase